MYGFDISHHLTYDVMHTLTLCVFKKDVHMLVKYAEGNGKIKDLDGALQIVKKLSDATLGTRWPRSLISLGFYKGCEKTPNLCYVVLTTCLRSFGFGHGLHFGWDRLFYTHS